MEENKIFADHEVFEQIKEPKNRFQGTNSARLHSLAGRYDNPIPTRFLAPLDCLKIPAQGTFLGIDSWAPLTFTNMGSGCNGT